MLTLITWRPGMAIDNGLIDDDHRHLVDIVNSFRSHDEHGRPALSQAVDSLYALKFYAQTHFEREEHLQCLVNLHQHREQGRSTASSRTRWTTSSGGPSAR